MHRVRSPLDAYLSYFSKHELAVAEVYCADAEAASITHVRFRRIGSAVTVAGWPKC